jgi:hypothetical protein
VANSLSHGLGFLLAIASLPILVASPPCAAVRRAWSALAHSRRRRSCCTSRRRCTTCCPPGVPSACSTRLTILQSISSSPAATRRSHLACFEGAGVGRSSGWCGLRLDRHPAEELQPPAPSGLVNWSVCRDGLAGADRCRSADSTCAPRGPAVAAGRWAGLHGGAVVFIFDSKLRYAHFVWHLLVLGGSTCHFFAALRYAS